MPFSLFMALKYLKPRRTFLSVVTVLSVLGVLLGVAVLMVVLSVMSGFDDMWRDKILSFNAHLVITSPSVVDDEDALIKQVQAVPGVTGAAPYVQGLVFLQHGKEVFTPLLRGVDAHYETNVSKIPQYMVRGKFDVDDDQMVVGRDLAQRLNLQVGDKVLVYSPQHFMAPDEMRLPAELTVSGIFDLGMWDFDMGYALTSMGTARELFDIRRGIHGVQAMTANPYQADVVGERVRKALGWEFDVSTWMELNKVLFASLRVEKNMMFFLLLFITVVAAFGITNTLITLAVQKTREIGLLKALGFSSSSIMGIFLWQGLIDGVIGTLAGLGTGWLMLRYRNNLLRGLSDTFNLELFPKSLYQLSEIPARTSWSDVLTVAGIVLVICTLAALIPAWRAARADPVKSLRYE